MKRKRQDRDSWSLLRVALIACLALLTSCSPKKRIPTGRFTVSEREDIDRFNTKFFLKEKYSQEEKDDDRINQIMEQFHQCQKYYDEKLTKLQLQLRGTQNLNERRIFSERYSATFALQGSECISVRDTNLQNRREEIKLQRRQRREEERRRNEEEKWRNEEEKWRNEEEKRRNEEEKRRNEEEKRRKEMIQSQQGELEREKRLEEEMAEEQRKQQEAAMRQLEEMQRKIKEQGQKERERLRQIREREQQQERLQRQLQELKESEKEADGEKRRLIREKEEALLEEKKILGQIEQIDRRKELHHEVNAQLQQLMDQHEQLMMSLMTSVAQNHQKQSLVQNGIAGLFASIRAIDSRIDKIQEINQGHLKELRQFTEGFNEETTAAKAKHQHKLAECADIVDATERATAENAQNIRHNAIQRVLLQRVQAKRFEVVEKIRKTQEELNQLTKRRKNLQEQHKEKERQFHTLFEQSKQLFEAGDKQNKFFQEEVQKINKRIQATQENASQLDDQKEELLRKLAASKQRVQELNAQIQAEHSGGPSRPMPLTPSEGQAIPAQTPQSPREPTPVSRETHEERLTALMSRAQQVMRKIKLREAQHDDSSSQQQQERAPECTEIESIFLDAYRLGIPILSSSTSQPLKKIMRRYKEICPPSSCQLLITPQGCRIKVNKETQWQRFADDPKQKFKYYLQGQKVFSVALHLQCGYISGSQQNEIINANRIYQFIHRVQKEIKHHRQIQPQECYRTQSAIKQIADLEEHDEASKGLCQLMERVIPLWKTHCLQCSAKVIYGEIYAKYTVNKEKQEEQGKQVIVPQQAPSDGEKSLFLYRSPNVYFQIRSKQVLCAELTKKDLLNLKIFDIVGKAEKLLHEKKEIPAQFFQAFEQLSFELTPQLEEEFMLILERANKLFKRQDQKPLTTQSCTYSFVRRAEGEQMSAVIPFQVNKTKVIIPEAGDRRTPQSIFFLQAGFQVVMRHKGQALACPPLSVSQKIKVKHVIAAHQIKMLGGKYTQFRTKSLAKKLTPENCNGYLSYLEMIQVIEQEMNSLQSDLFNTFATFWNSQCSEYSDSKHVRWIEKGLIQAQDAELVPVEQVSIHSLLKIYLIFLQQKTFSKQKCNQLRDGLVKMKKSVKITLSHKYTAFLRTIYEGYLSHCAGDEREKEKFEDEVMGIFALPTPMRFVNGRCLFKVKKAQCVLNVGKKTTDNNYWYEPSSKSVFEMQPTTNSRQLIHTFTEEENEIFTDQVVQDMINNGRAISEKVKQKIPLDLAECRELKSYLKKVSFVQCSQTEQEMKNLRDLYDRCLKVSTIKAELSIEQMLIVATTMQKGSEQKCKQVKAVIDLYQSHQNFLSSEGKVAFQSMKRLYDEKCVAKKYQHTDPVKTDERTEMKKSIVRHTATILTESRLESALKEQWASHQLTTADKSQLQKGKALSSDLASKVRWLKAHCISIRQLLEEALSHDSVQEQNKFVKQAIATYKRYCQQLLGFPTWTETTAEIIKKKHSIKKLRGQRKLRSQAFSILCQKVQSKLQCIDLKELIQKILKLGDQLLKINLLPKLSKLHAEYCEKLLGMEKIVLSIQDKTVPSEDQYPEYKKSVYLRLQSSQKASEEAVKAQFQEQKELLDKTKKQAPNQKLCDSIKQVIKIEIQEKKAGVNRKCSLLLCELEDYHQINCLKIPGYEPLPYRPRNSDVPNTGGLQAGGLLPINGKYYRVLENQNTMLRRVSLVEPSNHFDKNKQDQILRDFEQKAKNLLAGQVKQELSDLKTSLDQQIKLEAKQVSPGNNLFTQALCDSLEQLFLKPAASYFLQNKSLPIWLTNLRHLYLRLCDYRSGNRHSPESILERARMKLEVSKWDAVRTAANAKKVSFLINLKSSAHIFQKGDCQALIRLLRKMKKLLKGSQYQIFSCYQQNSFWFNKANEVYHDLCIGMHQTYISTEFSQNELTDTFLTQHQRIKILVQKIQDTKVKPRKPILLQDCREIFRALTFAQILEGSTVDYLEDVYRLKCEGVFAMRHIKYRKRDSDISVQSSLGKDGELIYRQGKWFVLVDQGHHARPLHTQERKLLLGGSYRTPEIIPIPVARNPYEGVAGLEKSVSDKLMKFSAIETMYLEQREEEEKKLERDRKFFQNLDENKCEQVAQFLSKNQSRFKELKGSIQEQISDHLKKARGLLQRCINAHAVSKHLVSWRQILL